MMCGGLGGRKEGRKKESRKERKRKNNRNLPWHRFRFHVPGSTFLWNTMPEHRLIALPVLTVLRQLINSVPDFEQEVSDMFSRMKNRRMESTTCEMLMSDILLHNKITDYWLLATPT